MLIEMALVPLRGGFFDEFTLGSYIVDAMEAANSTRKEREMVACFLSL